MSDEFTIKQLAGLHEVSAEHWNKVAGTSNPFVRYEYLANLERYDCLANHGWIPFHQVIYSAKILVGALPLYLKTNSYGEFVFDWAWADAYERAGGRYYPKLVSAIPFAPVMGPRLLAVSGHPQENLIRNMLVKQVLGFSKSKNLSSFHCLFSKDPQDIYQENKLLQRNTVQFQWKNRGYRDFNDFLDTFSSKKRKQVRRERKKIQDEMLEINIFHGRVINGDLWDVYYEFYCSTFHKRWGNPRLTKDFFKSLSISMPEQTLIILAKSGSKYVAGSFLMSDGETLYGRHWGCNEHYSYLHFELCYYQPIQYCIENGIEYFDAGVQGEHKLARGFEPMISHSYHWIENQQFKHAIKQYLSHEKKEIDSYVDELNSHLPYKSGFLDT